MENGKETILVTGGAGYIGAHIVRQLEAAGHPVMVIDDLSTGKQGNLGPQSTLMQDDFGNQMLLDTVFSTHKIAAVIHLAASIEVGESVEKPLEYLENNTLKVANLIQSMIKHGVGKLIFSSTGSVYSSKNEMPLNESASLEPINPYSRSKMLTENLIRYYSDFCGLQAVVFRYFNVAGSDFDKTIYSQHESHLIPRVIKAAKGELPELEIYGDDYSTPDGTGVRDYVHVLDIAAAHLAGYKELANAGKEKYYDVFNIGTGQGYSVKDIIKAVENFSEKNIPTKTLPRRVGDPDIIVADNSKLKMVLKYEPKNSDLETIIKTSWQ